MGINKRLPLLVLIGIFFYYAIELGNEVFNGTNDLKKLIGFSMVVVGSALFIFGLFRKQARETSKKR